MSHFSYAIYGPFDQFRDLYEPRFPRFTVHDDDHEVVLPTTTLEADGKAGARRRCNARLDTRVGAQGV